MVAEAVTEELREFIVDNFDSIEAIELVLLLRNTTHRRWEARELNRVLRSNLQAVLFRLNHLIDQGLIHCEESEGVQLFHYAPYDDRVARLMTELSETYITRRFTVINVVYADDRQNLRRFSDAFRIRGGRGGG